ncbi:MAG: hypothetical protein KatS3mg067_1244 [Thermosynechococcus sp.]|uniref:hypothetical protein n=1 Tax=Thermosynechococcus sp. TaxID=2814275 RepID=UPI0022035B8C|nr:hypothetical protein [Thermosynechococcus sp.]BCX12306.1 MAG: hypothetical protein KatS3mg067_1244 [Thermosynechococcus sp.]
MRAWIYLGAIALLAILMVQNWQPLVSLRFLGQQTPALPLAAWIVVAALAGIVAGQCLLWLTLEAQAPTARPTPRSPAPEPELDASMRPPQDEPEMDTSDVEDWFSEPEPAPREPDIQDRPPTTYSYQYRPSRKATAKTPPPPPQVVDAEYRILTPPPPKDAPPEDEADWDIPL